MKELFAGTLLFLGAILIMTGLWIGGGFVGLWWYPFQLEQQQRMITVSPGYVASKQQEIASFISGYDDPEATDSQRKGLLTTICLDASQISGKLPLPEAQFVSAHCQ